ncbi:MAG: hypothetical protein AAFO86_06870, partial [Pseudomonadota bacterium]
MAQVRSEDIRRPGMAPCALYVLSLGMVLVGLLNATPGIPGYDDLAAALWGQDGVKFRKFASEW